MRSYIRHPSDVPLEYRIEGDAGGDAERLANVSHGGVSFKSRQSLPEGRVITLSISSVEPSFEARAQVRWCQREGDAWIIGVEFLDVEDAYRARMVEQVCHIEQYKRDVQRQEQRTIDGEQAALEWISKFAKNFPSE